ncbi:DUF1127 domain-containing protein [Bradyrhizobium sp. NP1]|uniref:DUF1127 domain-containing protein n=1 Tax=Bradyrhizobium sp. NP1 TaxID=3049772 RepID=UPI0025A5EBC6|nr:DUF1127 domain-containing protein [Bradyrhizobium sp. NP1]WJR76247.1 DUF1127 domain-containing protein [Bradyrhizobium sp. NP1]
MTTIFMPSDRSAARHSARQRSGWFARCVSRLAVHWMRREAIRALHRLDDRELRDIGLMRSQIEPAVKGEWHLRP